MTLQDLKDSWVDTELYHKNLNELFRDKVNADPQLKAHRNYVETNIWGFGERSFWWMWKLICDELPNDAKMLEVGVFRAATISLWRILKKDAGIIGVTPLDTSGDVWESNYADDIWKIHQDFDLEQPTIVPYRSESEQALNIVKACSDSFDCVYIDGDHSYNGCMSDLQNYAPMVKIGGYLVIDDAACRTKQNFGVFQGIEDVCRALQNWELNDLDNEWEFQFNVVHNMVYKRVK